VNSRRLANGNLSKHEQKLQQREHVSTSMLPFGRRKPFYTPLQFPQKFWGVSLGIYPWCWGRYSVGISL